MQSRCFGEQENRTIRIPTLTHGHFTRAPIQASMLCARLFGTRLHAKATANASVQSLLFGSIFQTTMQISNALLRFGQPFSPLPTVLGTEVPFGEICSSNCLTRARERRL